MLSQRIKDVLNQNYKVGAILHSVGIPFYQFDEKETLQEICQKKGLDIKIIEQTLQKALQKHENPILIKYPVDLVISYLKHMHHEFINRKIPYLAELIQYCQPQEQKHQSIISDLQIFFPLFVEEFILHIHEEEDNFFNYIIKIHKASLGKINLNQLFFDIEKNPIQNFALEHHQHDDDMRGIREITHNYLLPKKPSLLLEVLFAELKAFEKELILHANIEDHILLPKAIKLEKLVKTMINNRKDLN
ncbi:MAG: iron-sulfur cluster repair di-iron protein [Cytophagales bacterium]|nr:MAG: iron-sulfur cluster repair di-iron protein [Cytophagales bacterium]